MGINWNSLLTSIANCNEMRKDSEDEFDICKWLDTWQKAYSFKVELIKGRAMWPKSDCPTKLIPPPHRTQVEQKHRGKAKVVEARLHKKKDPIVQQMMECKSYQGVTPCFGSFHNLGRDPKIEYHKVSGLGKERFRPNLVVDNVV
uniref:Uncharacterized protein n=1 Tax=Lactuca sativa TaxID=4236 RepID=A0A9R1XEI1_LACSA|nr:hypothetical protein LSAT_V11C400227610 [Lactuca sativa]